MLLFLFGPIVISLNENQILDKSIYKRSSSHAVNCTTGHRPDRVSASHSSSRYWTHFIVLYAHCSMHCGIVYAILATFQTYFVLFIFPYFLLFLPPFPYSFLSFPHELSLRCEAVDLKQRHIIQMTTWERVGTKKLVGNSKYNLPMWSMGKHTTRAKGRQTT